MQMKQPKHQTAFRAGPGSAPPGKAKKNGRMYFSRQAEQKVFFYLTLAMLAAGMIYRVM